MTRKHVLAVGLAAAFTLTFVGLPLRAADEPIDYDSLNKIKTQGLVVATSQVMDISSWLTDVHGPRLSGSPGIQKAGEWSVDLMKKWGLENVALEPWPADPTGNNNGFPRGWTNDKFYLAAVAPQAFPIPGTPSAWTPGTNGLVRGDVLLVTETAQADLQTAYAGGKLKGKWVITAAAPDVAAYWTPPAQRYTQEELDNMEAPRRAAEFGAAAAGGRGGAAGAAAAPAPMVPGAPAGAAPAAGAGGGGAGAGGGRAAGAFPGGRAGGAAGGAAPFNRNEFFRSEGVLGVFTTAPRGHGVYTIGGGSRTADPATLLPSIAIPAEQYGRIARMLSKNQTVTIEADIKNTYHPNPPMFNVVGEIRGTDKADEVVMLGAHFDSWHASTGATDNVAGSAAMLEAMRILKHSGVPLRRTVRIGLWNGEEQGLIGSNLYVRQHFGGGRGGRGGAAPVPPTPAHAKFSAYFNIDNGTGAIRGVYLQQNQAVGPIFRAWMEPFRSLGMTTLNPGNTGGTDHQSFDATNLPGFQFIQDEVEYRLDDAPHEPRQLRTPAARGHAAQRDDRRRVRVPRRQPRGEAPPQAGHRAASDGTGAIDTDRSAGYGGYTGYRGAPGTRVLRVRRYDRYAPWRSETR